MRTRVPGGRPWRGNDSPDGAESISRSPPTGAPLLEEIGSVRWLAPVLHIW